MTARGDEGSVLIESMIAAAVVAIMLGGLYQTIGASAQRHRMIEARRAALMIAQSELASVGADIPVATGRTSGVSGGYIWEVETAPYGAGGITVSDAGRAALVTVSVSARDGGGPLATLRSVRLAPLQ
jgi:general secretion pathway protein I